MIVDFYEEVGYLPDAIINYLMLLGWSLDDKTEFFTREQMIANFSLERVNKSPASFDCKKLWAFEDHYMQQVPPKQKVAKTLPYLATRRPGFRPAAVRHRAKTAANRHRRRRPAESIRRHSRLRRFLSARRQAAVR